MAFVTTAMSEMSKVSMERFGLLMESHPAFVSGWR